MKLIKLPCYGITINCRTSVDDPQATIKSDLHDTSEHANDKYNTAVETLEHFILACYEEGVDVDCPPFVDAIETVIERLIRIYTPVLPDAQSS